ncbi:Glycosyl transferase [Dorcoceras hygrometricum]|uniref:Glycosyltransferases n=1 Tax=Dorcoceras hygrometricum TaxID=472368 RepID=A0A2Z7DJC5_9LAMI|nr:Glycosyl transferase [Dorcoceras hygrometricum]
MASLERSKKKMHLWKKAIVHFILCFVMGFFTGFTPAGKASIFSGRVSAPKTVEAFQQTKTQNLNRSLLDERQELKAHVQNLKREVIPEKVEEKIQETNSRRLVIVVTPTSRRTKLREVFLSRLANTLRLVAQPLLWIIVEQKSDESKVSEVLRQTGIMYRHVVFKENFTDFDSEMDYQRNIALNHIEHHRLSGIVHFAGLSSVYDLSFFEEIRAIQAFGTWPIARLSANRKRVIIEGPICDSSEVVGWHLNKMSNLTDTPPPPIHISSFAFNSSILWDPERWGRTSSIQDASQDSLKFVEKEVLEEETNLKGIPAQTCSNVLLWDLHISFRK